MRPSAQLAVCALVGLAASPVALSVPIRSLNCGVLYSRGLLDIPQLPRPPSISVPRPGGRPISLPSDGQGAGAPPDAPPDDGDGQGTGGPVATGPVATTPGTPPDDTPFDDPLLDDPPVD